MERNNVKKQVEQGIEAVQQAAPQTNLSYFAELWTAFLTGPPQHDLHYIAVLGTGIPEIYLRAAGYSILALDRETIPHQTMPSFYRDMQMNFLLQVETVAGNAPSIEELLYEADLETRAHYALHRLDETDLPQLIKIFVRQSYYIAADREAWLWQLELLIQQSGPSAGEALLLIGSPISFPRNGDCLCNRYLVVWTAVVRICMSFWILSGNTFNHPKKTPITRNPDAGSGSPSAAGNEMAAGHLPAVWYRLLQPLPCPIYYAEPRRLWK